MALLQQNIQVFSNGLNRVPISISLRDRDRRKHSDSASTAEVRGKHQHPQLWEGRDKARGRAELPEETLEPPEGPRSVMRMCDKMMTSGCAGILCGLDHRTLQQCPALNSDTALSSRTSHSRAKQSSYKKSRNNLIVFNINLIFALTLTQVPLPVLFRGVSFTLTNC